ncbi:MAG: hypothetical protein GF307_06485 [candidate division Zixibacteria bacterium]|nr:hypothetical protein [candidate division Zixibacteria bacterium]
MSRHSPVLILFVTILFFSVMTPSSNAETRVMITDFSSVRAKIDGLKTAQDFRDEISAIPGYSVLARDTLIEILKHNAAPLNPLGPFSRFFIDQTMESRDIQVFIWGEFKEEYAYIYFTYCCIRNDKPELSTGGRIRWYTDKFKSLPADLLDRVIFPDNYDTPYDTELRLMGASGISQFEADLFYSFSKELTVTAAGKPAALELSESGNTARYDIDMFGIPQLTVNGNVVHEGYVGGFGFSPSQLMFIYNDSVNNIYIGDPRTGDTKRAHIAFYDNTETTDKPGPYFINDHQFVCYGSYDIGQWSIYNLGISNLKEMNK